MKLICPFCNQDKIFIGVHDDEGNYHGELGCEYEAEPWSGLRYGLHHEGWGECIMCTDGKNGAMGCMLFDTAEEAEAELRTYMRTNNDYLADYVREQYPSLEYSSSFALWKLSKQKSM